MPKMKRIPAPLMDDRELIIESAAMMANQPAPTLTMRSARSFCSTKFVSEDCDAAFRPAPGVAMEYLKKRLSIGGEVAESYQQEWYLPSSFGDDYGATSIDTFVLG